MPSTEQTPAIEVIDLIKDFGGRRAVDNISFEVPRGEICGLLGPNGALSVRASTSLEGCCSR